jgi:hypothetical protein
LSLPFINVRFMRVGKTASLLPVPDIFNESIEVQALRMTFCGADFGQMKLISTTFFGISLWHAKMDKRCETIGEYCVRSEEPHHHV